MLLPNAGVVQNAADVALRDAFRAKRKAEEARRSRVEQTKWRKEGSTRRKSEEQTEVEATAEQTEARRRESMVAGGYDEEQDRTAVAIKKEAVPLPPALALSAAPFVP